MMSNTFYKKREILNIEKLRALLRQLPNYLANFFVSIDSTTTPLTRLNYAIDLNLFYDYLSQEKFFKDKKQITLQDIDSLKAFDLEMFLSYLSNYTQNDKTLTNADITKARKLSSIRSFLKFCFDKDLISANVASKVKTPKTRQKEIIRLEVDEVAKLINQAANPDLLSSKQQAFNKHTSKRDTALLSLFLGTGIRVSECVGLDVDDIDFENNAFKITRKGGAQVVLYFSDEVADSLRDWIAVRNRIKELSEDEKALFVSLQNKRMGVRAVENLVKKYSKVVSPLKKISPHKLRSTYGTNLYRETKDIYIVADVLGHKDVNTTKKHYAAISEDIRRDAANKVKLR